LAGATGVGAAGLGAGYLSTGVKEFGNVATLGQSFGGENERNIGGGALAGAGAGAAIGSIVPGVGTAIGAGIGGLLGGIGGALGGDGCIIVTTATHPDSEEVNITRQYRDRFLDKETLRGYYVIAEKVVPLMKKYPLFKKLVKRVLVDNLIEYGRYALEQAKIHGMADNAAVPASV
jgi:hypothetical protein